MEAGNASRHPREAMMDQRDKQIVVETAGSVLWFFMDGFWMLSQPVPAKAMVWPALAVNLFVFRYTKRSFGQIAVVAAMNCWLVMNICWMRADLDKDPKPLAVARILFFLGAVLLALAVGREAVNQRRVTEVLAHFRRLRT
jgi:hypothetical protein